MTSHGLFEEKVRLTDNHEYLDAEGNRYMGFSSFCDNFLMRPFNSSGAAYGVAKSAINKGEHRTAQSVIDEWEEQRDLGDRIDKAITRFFRKQEMLDTDLDIVDLVHSVAAEYESYKSVFNQLIVYNEQYRIAGAIDNMVLTSNRQDGQFILSDFKVFNKQDNLHDHKGWLHAPMSHMSNTKCVKINIQLSFYAFQLEQLLGKRCKQLFIHLIDPINRTHKKIVVPYLKNDVILLLETNKEKIKELVTVNKSMSINDLI